MGESSRPARGVALSHDTGRPAENPREPSGVGKLVRRAFHTHSTQGNHSMLVQVNFGDVQHSEAIESWTDDRIHSQLGHLTQKLTRVEVHLRDDNSASKSSHNDKRCVMEARIAGRRPLAVEHSGDDLYRVIDETAGKLSRAVKNDIERSAAR
jgi:ribosome-associated translation inhibitor RaiA